MKLICLTQGSKEWHAFRAGDSEYGIVVSASRVPSVLKEHSYGGSLSHEVFKEMFEAAGPKKIFGKFEERGHRVEAKAVDYVNELLALKGDNVVAISERYPWLSASYDWFHPVGGVWEIKSPGRKVFERAKVEGIPAYYKGQMETQLICTDGLFDRAMMLMWPPEDGLVPGEEPLEMELILTPAREALIVRETKRFRDDLEAALLGETSRMWLPDDAERVRARQYRSGGGDTFSPHQELEPADREAWDQKMDAMLEARKNRLTLDLQLKAAKASEDAAVSALVDTLSGVYGYEVCEDVRTGTRITVSDVDGSVSYKDLVEHYEALLGLPDSEKEAIREQHRGEGRQKVTVTAQVDKEVKGTSRGRKAA